MENIERKENVITTGINPFKVLWSEQDTNNDTYREISAIETSDGVILKCFYSNLDHCGENITKIDGVRIDDLMNDR